MSSIKIVELRPAGSELCQDSESFLNQLSDGQEMDMVLGGGGRKGGPGGNVNTSVITKVNTKVNITNIYSITAIVGGRRRKH